MKNKIVLISAAFVLVTAALMFTGCGDPGGGGGTNAATPTITTQPQSAEYVYGRDSTVIPLTVAATVSDGGKLTYQWFYKTDVNGAGNKISGEVYEEYEPYEIWLDDPPENEEGDIYYYYVEVTNTNSKATGNKTAKKTSDYAVVTYVEKNDWDAVTPSISVQPKGASYSAGSTGTVAALTVTASKSSLSGTLSYQWYSTPTGSTTDGVGVTTGTGGTTASYTPDIDLSDEQSMGLYYYYVVVTNTDNTAPGENKIASVTSDVATITVTAGENWSAATPILTPISFGEKTETFAGDTAATLTVTATLVTEPTVGTLSYQWYKASSANGAGEEVGTNSNTYTVSADDLTAFGDFWFYVEVTNTNNAAPNEKSKTATSNRARITIIDAALPVITDVTLGGNKSFNIGSTAPAPVLNGTATVPSGATLTYAWYSNATNSNTSGTLVDGATDPTFKPADLTTESNLYYYVEVSNGEKKATSNAARYAVNDPASAYVISGSGTSFTAVRGSETIASSQTITNVISAIKNHSAGNDCTVQFGDLSNAIDIGNSVSAAFTNVADSPSTPWGTVTITGKITGGRPGNEGTVYINGDGAAINAILKADIANTNTATGTSLANTGKAVAIVVTDESVVEIQDGAISAVGTGNAVYINAGTVTISGGTLTSANNSQNTTSGTTNQAGSGSLIITGTATVQNTNNTADARTMYSNSSGATKIYGGTITGGSNARVISIASATGSTASLHLAGSPTINGGANENIYFSQGHRIYIDSGTGIPPVSFTNPSGATLFRVRFAAWPANSNPDRIAVVGGATYSSNFTFSNGTPTTSGNNLVGGSGATW